MGKRGGGGVVHNTMEAIKYHKFKVKVNIMYKFLHYKTTKKTTIFLILLKSFYIT